MQKNRQKTIGNAANPEADVAKAPTTSLKGEMEKINPKMKIGIELVNYQIRVPSPLERGWGEAKIT